MQKAEWYLPLAYTADCSLTHGVELNTHMMTLEYLKTNQHLITHTMERLVAGGATHLADGYPTSGVHVHVDRSSICQNNNDLIQTWLKSIRPFLLQFSFRTEDRFNHYCERSYKYFGARNNGNTWECRGFSSELVLKHPDSVYHICAWVATMAYVSRNPWLIFNTPAEALCVAGYSETATYIREVLRVVTIDMIPTVELPKRDTARLSNQAVRIHNGEVCWFLETQDNGTAARLIRPGQRSASYYSINEIVEWFHVSPQPQQTPEEYLAELSLVSEVPPCAL